MNFIQHNPLLVSGFMYFTITGIFSLISFILRKGHLSLGLILFPVTILPPLLLFLSGYYIVPEQYILGIALPFWSLVKILQTLRRGIYLTLRPEWIIKASLACWTVLLPFALYLTSRPVRHKGSLTLVALLLMGLSLGGEILRKRKKIKTYWGPFYEVFHPGTLPYIWGMFLISTPQLIGMEWLSLTGPVLYTGLVLRPWTGLLRRDNTVTEQDEEPEYNFRDTPSLLQSRHREDYYGAGL